MYETAQKCLEMFSFESDVCAIEDDNLLAHLGQPKVTQEEGALEMKTELCLINKKLEIEMIKKGSK